MQQAARQRCLECPLASSFQIIMHPMLNVAVRAARAAGRIINNASREVDLLRVAVKGVNDFVTEVDQASEQAIIETLLQAYPDHGILGEETGQEYGNPDSDYQWIIDPLDGTTNFLHGLPIYCVSIGLMHRGIMTQAVVYDPSRDELFTATRGSGAFVNNRRLRVSKRIALKDSLVGTGFPYRSDDGFGAYMRVFAAVTRACVGVRRPGAAALDLAYVAAGRYDAFFECGLKPWDMAAGSLLVQEAGGLVADYRGEGDFLKRHEIVAGAPKVFAQLMQLLQKELHVAQAQGNEPVAGSAAAALIQAH